MSVVHERGTPTLISTIEKVATDYIYGGAYNYLVVADYSFGTKSQSVRTTCLLDGIGQNQPQILKRTANNRNYV